ncbi:MAG TPA: hypothetical protein VL095_11615 [Flavisolibacter sp.]|nr:hypothetical protein [Flavisolibacter sp.]
MKKRFFLFASVLFFSIPTKLIAQSSSASKQNKTSNSRNNADTTIKDSLGYVKGILTNKDKYIGKEFGLLIKDLDMQIKSYSSVHVDRFSSSGILISFDDWATTANKASSVKGLKDPVRLAVIWQNPISRADVEAHLKRAAGEWGEAQQKYFSKLIVKDIR